LQGVVNVTEKVEEDIVDSQQRGLSVELQSVDQLPEIFDFLFEQKIKLVNFKREEPSLEDAFIELTKKA
jgi:transglutaminase/protease-like cytokinesis protein 3